MSSALARQKDLADLVDKTRKARRSSASAVRWSPTALTAEDQRASRRRALLVEAGRAFAARGFHNTTLDDIAQSLNVTKAALYRYVKSKHDLLYELHDIAAKISEDALDVAERDAQTPVDVVRMYARHYMEALTGEFGAWAMLLDRSSMLPEHDLAIQRRRRIVDTRLRSAAQAAMDQNLVPPGDAKLVVFYIHGAINWMYYWYRDRGPDAREHVIDSFIQYSMAALGAPSRAAKVGEVDATPPVTRHRAAKA